MTAGMRWIAIILATASSFGGCSCPPVTISPPRVPEGGRALSIAVTSNNVQRLFVATETGGVFRTFNGGESWQHLGGLPNFRMVDVAVASLAPNTIIATALTRFRGVNDGGIWRSTDGGGTWTQPAGSLPPPSRGCPGRPSAFGISHLPLSRTFHVGTDCGVAVSNDNGATWTHFVLDPAAPVEADSGQHRVRSLLIFGRTSGVAAADAGIFFLDATGAWRIAAIPPTPGRVPVPHAFASPHLSGARSIFFHASGGDDKVFVSTDNGASWRNVPAPSVNNREAFVRIARSVNGDDSRFDVYFGDGQQFHRQSFSVAGAVGTGSWTRLTIDHLDPSDVAFDLEHRIPILLASDGGVHRTTDQGSSWKMTGAGFNGFNALQIAEVTGQSVEGSAPHLDLYYATQDNGIVASPDGGQTWTGRAGGEGRGLRTHPTSVNHQGTRVTGGKVGAPENYQSEPHFANVRPWPSAPNGNEPDGSEAPFLIVEDAYLQPSFDTQAMPPSFDYFLTMTAGAVWTRSFTLPLKPKGAAYIAGSPANPTVYQGVFLPGQIDGGSRFGLQRASNLAGTALVRKADSVGIGAIGSLRTPIARYIVVGVSTQNQDHLIAPDIENDEMKFSVDGGAHWHPMPALTQAVTDSGRFRFHLVDTSLPSVIRWDPYDPCRILVGTIQNGIIQSVDGGRNWAPIAGTRPVTSISSFFFPPTGPIWISTNGRGLWRLKLTRPVSIDPSRCAFPDPPPDSGGNGRGGVLEPLTGARRNFAGPGDSIVCATCTLVSVTGGWITELPLSADSVRHIGISGGVVRYVDRAGSDQAPRLPNRYVAGDGRHRDTPFGRGLTGELRVRGLIVDGVRLRGVVAATGDLPHPVAAAPGLSAHPAGVRGADAVIAGDTLRLLAWNLVPPSRGGRAVRVLFDGSEVARDVPVRENGTLELRLLASRGRGELGIVLEQQDGPRLTRVRTTIDVVGREGEVGVRVQ